MAERSKAMVCGQSLAEIAGLIAPGTRMSVSRECCMLSGRRLCKEPIPRTEESY